MSLTPEQFAKLPKYAQQELQAQQAEIESLREAVASFEGSQKKSPFRISVGRRNETVQYLNPDHGIEVVLSEDEGTEAVIGIYVEEHPVLGNRLRLMGEGYPNVLHLVPQASNVAVVTVGRY